MTPGSYSRDTGRLQDVFVRASYVALAAQTLIYLMILPTRHSEMTRRGANCSP